MGEWIRTHCCIRKFVEENGQKTMKKTKGPECHLTFTKETPFEIKYLTEFFLTLVQHVLFMQSKWWMFCLNSTVNTIKAILVDNTNTNTGCEGGMVAILEKNV